MTGGAKEEWLVASVLLSVPFSGNHCEKFLKLGLKHPFGLNKELLRF